MDDSRKKRGWAFWASAALLLSVVYVASFGPATWLMWNCYTRFHVNIRWVYDPLYAPIFAIGSRSTATSTAIDRYVFNFVDCRIQWNNAD